LSTGRTADPPWMKKTADSRRILARNMSYFLVSEAKQSRWFRPGIKCRVRSTSFTLTQAALGAGFPSSRTAGDGIHRSFQPALPRKGPAVFAVFTGNYQRGSLVHRRNPGAPAEERTKEQRDNGLFGTNRLMANMNAKSLGAWGAWQRVKQIDFEDWIGRLLKSHISLNLSIGDDADPKFAAGGGSSNTRSLAPRGNELSDCVNAAALSRGRQKRGYGSRPFGWYH
jgi:hypothetical protein